ncbi:hypothetical protein [Burkholderia cepacia]|uniref:hypothetical protein n=1 Tax=Burkholderia cepacia TaxID=292 RepID=UPI000F5DC1B3|nr:hypothetical protein [Burkholderia cepacia]
MPMAIKRKPAGFEGLWENGAFFTALPFRSKLYVADPTYAASKNARLRLKIDATNVTQSHIFLF